MKKVLFILSHSECSHLNVNESVQALLLLASYGLEIHVLFRQAGLSLLSHADFDVADLPFLKSTAKMVQSFEFYDIEHLYVSRDEHMHPWVQQSNLELNFVDVNRDFFQQFDHVLQF